MKKSGQLTSNKSDGRKLTHEQSEYIRIQAVKAVRKQNENPEDVTRRFTWVGHREPVKG